MDFGGALVTWLSDPAHWRGSDGIPQRIVEHCWLSLTPLVVAILIALPIGVGLGHVGRGGFIAMNVANAGRALPSLAIIALSLPLSFALGLGLGFWPTVFALVPLAVPPILTNSYLAVRQVDRDIVEAARGMGMRAWQIVLEAELPLAAPLILAGVRNAAVSVVATATLGALVASGGLGRYIVDGLARQENERLFVGALLVAGLAVGTEAVLSLVERAAVSSLGPSMTGSSSGDAHADLQP